MNMTVDNMIFAELFALWPNSAALARDMGLTGAKCSRAYMWVKRGYLDPWYWPRFIDVLEQRFARVVTYRQLVEAAAAQRGHSWIAETRRRNRDSDGRSEAA